MALTWSLCMFFIQKIILEVKCPSYTHASCNTGSNILEYCSVGIFFHIIIIAKPGDSHKSNVHTSWGDTNNFKTCCVYHNFPIYNNICIPLNYESGLIAKKKKCYEIKIPYCFIQLVFSAIKVHAFKFSCNNHKH